VSQDDHVLVVGDVAHDRPVVRAGDDDLSIKDGVFVVKPCLLVAGRDAEDVEPLLAQAADEVGIGLAVVEQDPDGDAGAAALGEGADQALGGEVEEGDVDGSGRGADLRAKGGFEGAPVAGGGEVDGDGIVPGRKEEQEEQREGYLSLFLSPRRTTFGALNLAISASFR
jgi:hypothetical protein